ncbi:MAG TPA: hypothetical protein VGH28_18705 [Polyangiaceae bacterium]|jgi:hypothetical protein
MRKPYLLLAFVPAAIVWACGGGDDNLNLDGGPDATSDSAPKTDASSNDSATNDSSTNDGAADAAADVTLTLDCFKPADCVDGGDPDAAYPPDSGVVCCGTVTGNGNANACQIEGATTLCKDPASCKTSFTGLVTCSSATVRFCTTDSECTEGSASQCCTANGGDAGKFHVCASTAIANFSGGKITCP